jgi:enoyl-CoA hydratase/carnithine racemase
MAYETLLLEKQGHVAVLTLNRPTTNAVNYIMLQELDKALEEVAADKDARVLVITGSGEKAFCAGMDVGDAVSHPDVGAVGRVIWTKLDRLEKPTIAAINGHALGGGCELTLACHFRYMADNQNSKMGCPELNLGIIPGWGGTQRLTRLLGRNKALDLMLNSRRLSPQEALTLGLVDGLYPQDQLMSQVLEKAQALAEKAPLAVRSAIRAVCAHEDCGIDTGLRLEGEGADICASSQDAIEGFTAFMQKRKPEFKGE